MKKITTYMLIAIVIFSFFTTSNSNAQASSQDEVKSVTLKIEYISYSDHDSKYYMFTENDEGGMNWGLVCIDKKLPNNKLYYKIFNKLFVGKYVTILYTGDLLNNEDVELIDFFIKA